MVATAGGVGLGGFWSWKRLRLQATLAGIQSDIQQARPGLANRKLVEVLKRDPDCDEAIYLLGVCQKARGQFDLSFQTLGRVRPGTPFTVPSILERGMMLATAGRLADLERLATHSLADPLIDPAGPRWFLVPFYWREGRRLEARRMIKTSWDEILFTRQGTLDQAVKLVRMHMEWSLSPPSIEETGGFLEQAEARAPDDPRVWLGKANLAIRAGSLAEAARWIDATLKREPEDAPAWRARLDWAVASGKLPEARVAMDHLSTDWATPVLIPALTAWFAAQNGDLSTEKHALETLLANDPNQPVVLDRLAVLGGSKAGTSRRLELGRMMARYQRLFDRDQPGRDAPELASIAEHLGRWFEARAFWAIAQATGWSVPNLDGAIARLKARDTFQTNPDKNARTLADLIAPVVAGKPTPSSRANARAAAEVILNE